MHDMPRLPEPSIDDLISRSRSPYITAARAATLLTTLGRLDEK